ncbi:phosphate regulon sensor histidine kinase PhoR [Azohydromonas sediminis]|uniref:phosphate regulon sensor histidine kinase PhoR n=1 Tax=Azohydromonas sediminis TaxID=2259674 RepID=UPI001F313DDC|nr:phosphate regulon sensor histidine kinase PhoR [Azohydromonas sediminis]
MPWLLPRIVAALLAMLAGTAIGAWVGGWFDARTLGMALGGATGVSLATTLDALRARRLLDWLRGAQAAHAPAAGGFWGELAYRVERAMRTRETSIEHERGRLQQFLQAIEASPNGVLLLDADDQIEWCNAVAADHFGLDPARDRGQRVTHLVRTPAFVAHLQQGQFEHPVIVPGPLGRQTLSVLVRRYGDGMKLVLSQDVTERERSDAMRRDFVANVSHEMRTPLTVLAGFVETMATLPLTEVERQRVLKLMEQQTTRMQTLLTDLLTLAQLEGSPRPPADQWVSVDALMAQVRADGEALSAGRHLLVFHVPPGGEIAGSATELLSAVGNLVTNAVRYTPDGGRIDVHWRVRADGAGEIDVVDNGVGIDREHIPRLTERFYRVDGSRSRDTGGTGLGLSIVKHVVQRHGGELDIESERGKGSRFRIVVPAARVRVRHEAAAVADAPR